MVQPSDLSFAAALSVMSVFPFARLFDVLRSFHQTPDVL